MTRIAFSVVMLLSVATSAGAQQSRELLRPVDEVRSLRIEEYNSTFLKQQTYYASRYRIVEVNTRLLSEAQDITVTPFEGVEPIQLEPLPNTPRRNGEDHIFWSGRLKRNPLFEFDPEVSVTIAANAWDLEPSGNASVSSQNRFEFSPLWTVDEAGNVSLERSNVPGQGVVPGEPPRTTQQIERHKRLRSLNRRAFYSANGVFDVPGGSRYVLQELKYTPRYSVIYEVPRDTVIPVQKDVMPGDPEQASEERAAFERYKRFVETLPDDRGKAVREDAQ